jgi:hypothetical protein
MAKIRGMQARRAREFPICRWITPRFFHRPKDELLGRYRDRSHFGALQGSVQTFRTFDLGWAASVAWVLVRGRRPGRRSFPAFQTRLQFSELICHVIRGAIAIEVNVAAKRARSTRMRNPFQFGRHTI